MSMALDLSNSMAEVEKEKVHEFQVPGPAGQVGVLRVSHSKMKICGCGCDRFVQQFNVGWGRPSAVLGAPLICLSAPLWLCAKCGEELTPQAKTVEQYEASKLVV